MRLSVSCPSLEPKPGRERLTSWTVDQSLEIVVTHEHSLIHLPATVLRCASLA